jgi:hypothetical protein
VVKRSNSSKIKTTDFAVWSGCDSDISDGCDSSARRDAKVSA